MLIHIENVPAPSNIQMANITKSSLAYVVLCKCTMYIHIRAPTELKAQVVSESYTRGLKTVNVNALTSVY